MSSEHCHCNSSCDIVCLCYGLSLSDSNVTVTGRRLMHHKSTQPEPPSRDAVYDHSITASYEEQEREEREQQQQRLRENQGRQHRLRQEQSPGTRCLCCIRHRVAIMGKSQPGKNRNISRLISNLSRRKNFSCISCIFGFHSALSIPL